MKKKIVSIMVAAAMTATVLSGCGGSSSSSKDKEIARLKEENEKLKKQSQSTSSNSSSASSASSESTESSTSDTETKDAVASPSIKKGDKITTDDYEMTVKNIKFTSEVDAPDKSYGYSYYKPDSGNVFIDVVADVKNLMESDITLDDMYTATATYDDNYNYDGFIVEEDGSTFNISDSMGVAAPLTKCRTHYIIECPKEARDSDKDVIVTITAGGKNYTYKMPKKK